MTYDLDKLAALEAAYNETPRKPALPWYEAHERLSDAAIDALPAMIADLRTLREENDTLESAVLINQEGIRDLNNKLLALRADLREALEMLREVEWSLTDEFGDAVCPVCRQVRMKKNNNHSPDCRLDALKRRLEGK